MHHGDLDVAYGLRASFIHRRDLRCAFFLHPGTQLENADHHGVVLFGDLHRIADMVEVPVSTQQEIDFLDILLTVRAHGIPHDPGIDQNRLAAGSLDAKSSVA